LVLVGGLGSAGATCGLAAAAGGSWHDCWGGFRPKLTAPMISAMLVAPLVTAGLPFAARGSCRGCIGGVWDAG
jgi:hypothetical protein